MNNKYKQYMILILFLLMAGCNKYDNDSAQSTMVCLIIDYEKQSGFNYNDDAKVLVDGDEICVVKYGTTSVEKDIYLPVGKHTISLVSDTILRKNKSNKVSIDVDDDNTFYLNISQSTITGLKLDVVENNTYDCESWDKEEETDNSSMKPTDEPEAVQDQISTPTAQPSPTEAVDIIDDSIAGTYEIIDAYWDEDWGKVVNNSYSKADIYVIDGEGVYANLEYTYQPMSKDGPDYTYDTWLIPTETKDVYQSEDGDYMFTFLRDKLDVTQNYTQGGFYICGEYIKSDY